MFRPTDAASTFAIRRRAWEGVTAWKRNGPPRDAAAQPERISGGRAYFFFFAFFAAVFLRPPFFFAAMEISLLAHVPLGRLRDTDAGGLPAQNDRVARAARPPRARGGRTVRRERITIDERHAGLDRSLRWIGAAFTHPRRVAEGSGDDVTAARRPRTSRFGLLFASRIRRES